jgi:hypothetical protein
MKNFESANFGLVEMNEDEMNQVDGKMEHYVTYYGIKSREKADDEKIYIIGDPRTGVVELKEAAFNDIWQSKFALLLTPNTNFIKRENNFKSKWRWFQQDFCSIK